MHKLQEVIVYLHDLCNYHCSYCLLTQSFYQKSESSRAFTVEGTQAIINFFRKRGNWHIMLTGGEVVLHPEFARLVQELSQENYIRLDTNGSWEGSTLSEFMAAVAPERVDFVHCSLHEIDEEESRLSRYLERAWRLQQNGFKVLVSYVATPERMERLPAMYELFTAHGIPFLVQALRTDKYPANYTEEERALMDKYMISASCRYLLDHVRKPLGQLCNGGHSRLKIDGVNGKITRCFRSTQPIGNIYEDRLELTAEPTPCEFEACTYLYEPHVDMQELWQRDLEQIWRLPESYDREIFTELMKKGGS